MQHHSPKLRRRGKRNGLDIDYQVNISNINQIPAVHQQLMNDRTDKIFMYSKGDISYENAIATNSLPIFHYIDKDLNLYDYAFVLDSANPITKPKRTPDPTYAKSIKNPEFAKMMKYKKWLTAFLKHMIAYKIDTLDKNSIYAKRFDAIMDKMNISGYDEIEPSYKNIEYIKSIITSYCNGIRE